MHQRRKPIFLRFSKLLKVPFSRRPIIPKLKILIKTRKVKRPKLLKYSDFGFLHDYQFSPSSTPFIQYSGRRRRRLIDHSGFRRVCQVLFLSRCVRSLKNEVVVEMNHSLIELEPLPNVIDVASPTRELPQPLDDLGEDDSGDDSIDRRAERFIERFYEEMRMQRREIYLID